MPTQESHMFHNISCIDLYPIQFGKETCSPLQRYGPVKANHFLFHFVIDGKGEYWNLDTQKKYTIDKNKGFFMTPDTIGTYTADSEEPWSYLWIEFDGIKAAPFLKEAGINTKNPVFQLKNQLFLPNIVEPLETMIQYSHKHETFILAQLYLLMDHIISFSSSATSIRPSDLTNFYIREAIQLIQNHPQHNPTVEELANVCHLNKNYLTRLFSQELGVTPIKFIINYRLNDACQQLASTTKSIAEIAQSVGYTNQFNFSTALKKEKGLTPFEWRSLYR